MVYNPKLIEFFEKHNMYEKKMFDYFMNNSYMIDFEDPDQIPLVGCDFIITRGILTKIILIMPYLENTKTMLVSIHEIVHAIAAYKYLGKKVTDKVKFQIKDESLPLLYETIFIDEVGDEKLKKYQEHLDVMIDETSPEEYRKALRIRSELYSSYVDDMAKMQKKVKKLTQKKKHN